MTTAAMTKAKRLSSWQVATAAEAMAAAQFARFGYNVSVQYGANQPEYDLIAADESRSLKISVKGSADGGWGLTQSQMSAISKDKLNPRKGDYHGAADAWLKKHNLRTALCLVQFKNVADHELPRIYLAWPKEIADKLKAASNGRGETILWEDYTRTARAFAGGIREHLPAEWRMTRERVDQLMGKALSQNELGQLAPN